MATNIPFDDYLDEPLKDTEFKADVAAESTKLEIAVALPNACECARLAQSELAERADVLPSTIARIEMGRMPALI
ncbi:transcriptional regulator [Lactiplantibacillus pentosus]|uniref:transcriptional regulator n=1 Tax=Lactiplantibacillus pentosus TaxID=1589 RepID=UPI001CDA92A4|nr:transcriptional regulator [Lactiplantibacillus pentosus]